MKKTMLAVTALALFSAVAFVSQNDTAAQSINIQVRTMSNQNVRERIEILRQRTWSPRPSATPQQSPIVVTPSPSPQLTTAPSAGSSASLDQYREDVVRLVNEERAKRSLSPLVKNDALALSAQRYAQQMADNNFFSHTGHDGSTFVQRNKAAGYTNYRWMGENIAAGQRTPQEVMNGWMNSDGHRKNILYPEAKEMGVGYYVKPGSTYSRYWVQEFGSR